MSNTSRTLLIEIGTEELPPKSLRTLMDAFAREFTAALRAGELAFGEIKPYATPRRLALTVDNLGDRQPDQELELRGPPLRIAFDDSGAATKAAQAFADKCGVSVEQLGREKTEKGEWLVHRQQKTGQTAAALVPGFVTQALELLPIARRMRWGDSDAEFVRPVHWLVMIYGDELLPGTVLGIQSQRETYGHRFMAPAAVAIDHAEHYAELLRPAHVIADFFERRDLIASDIEKIAAQHHCQPVIDDELLDELSALTEWPVAITGSFDDEYLRLPAEVLISTLQKHQRYIPLRVGDGALLAKFVTIANLASTDPDQVVSGNERVIRPRLADAAFFWDTDRNVTFESRMEALNDVVYQRALGSVADKSRRVALLAKNLARAFGVDPAVLERAALLAKCDLLTGMVGEFPDLQGIMGAHYARAAGEDDAVATAIEEQYLPRFSGDRLPATLAGDVLALAERLDTLAGIFAIGKIPTGNRDPYSLRRAALGILRVLIEHRHDLDLRATITAALKLQPVTMANGTGTVSLSIYEFIMERLRAYYRDADTGIRTEWFDAVLDLHPVSPLDFDARIRAVAEFMKLPEAESLIAANKRIKNILRRSEGDRGAELNLASATEPAEKALIEAYRAIDSKARPLLAKREYTKALQTLAGLRETVDAFFDEIMVMVDDTDVRRNRLALLGNVADLFLEVADVAQLG